MPVNGLDHVNIRTHDLEATIAFYGAALGLKAGQGVAGPRSWLYDESGQAIFHLWPQEEAPETGGPVHHVALACDDRPAITARLEDAAIPFRVSERPHLTQVFITDPSGVMLELNFRGE